MDVKKDVYTNKSLKTIRTLIRRMGWDNSEDEKFIYLNNLTAEDVDIYKFIFDNYF